MKLSANTPLTGYWNMPFGTGYSALRCKEGLFLFHPWFKHTEESQVVKQERKKNPMNLAKLEKFQELLHTKKNNNNCKKISVETSSESAAKLSCSSLHLWIDLKQCVHQIGGGDGHFKCNLLPSPTISLPPLPSRDLTQHPVMNRCGGLGADHNGDCSLITCSGQQMTVSTF